MRDRLGGLLVLVTGVLWSALRCWPLVCVDYVIPV